MCCSSSDTAQPFQKIPHFAMRYISLLQIRFALVPRVFHAEHYINLSSASFPPSFSSHTPSSVFQKAINDRLMASKPFLNRYMSSSAFFLNKHFKSTRDMSHGNRTPSIRIRRHGYRHNAFVPPGQTRSLQLQKMLTSASWHQIACQPLA